MTSRMQKLFALSMCVIGLCVAVRAQVAAPTPKRSEEPATGAIDGRVVNESGQPLAGAALFIKAVGGMTGRNTTSDLDGNFRVTGLEPSLYIISANTPAYTSVTFDPTAPVYYRLGDTVRLELVRGGVITGTVTNSFGEPVIAVRVRAAMIRDSRGQTSKPFGYAFGEQLTDDRGIYRIFGLAPGTYLVSAGGSGFSPTFNSYDTDVPTFAPSSTRDTAAEVGVRTGEETNVDIRYRGESGHSVSGVAKGSAQGGTSIVLTVAGSVIPLATTYQLPGSRGFAFNGLGDGEYELTAQEVVAGPTSTPLVAFSENKKVTIKGADVTGIELVTRPLGSISGRISLETTKVPECQGKRPPLLAETLVQAQRPEKEMDDDTILLRALGNTSTPDPSGAFVLRNRVPGRYRFEPRYYARYWYLKSVTTSTGGAKPQTIDAAANWTMLKSGEQLSNLTITLAEGAASIRGAVPVAEGSALPAGMTVYLVPNEADKAEDVLRYFVTNIAADGTFAFDNLPPGKYLALTQTSADPQTATPAKLRLPEAAAARTKLRRAAEAKKANIELKPCQNLSDYQLKQ